MRFGIFALPTYFAETDGSVDQFYQHVLALMEDAESLGFHSGWCNEHHFHPYGGMIPAPPVLLAALAARTSRLRLGTSVALLPLHHPLRAERHIEPATLVLEIVIDPLGGTWKYGRAQHQKLAVGQTRQQCVDADFPSTHVRASA